VTGNGADQDSIRLDWAQLTGDDTPCDHCGGHLPDHAWADLDPEGHVVNCSGERP